MALANITNNVLTDSGTNLSSLATQTYVGTAISNLVASSPATLDTLNELAAALGNDAAFSTTVSTALGNRLRVDINTQGLSATLQGYGRTNLGLGTAATSNTGDFVAYRTFGTAANSATGDFVAYRTFGTAANNNTGDFAAASHTHSIANVTGLQTALDGKQASGSYAAATHSHIISDVTGLQTALDGKQASLGFTPYNATNPSGYITSSGSISGNAATATSAGVLTASGSLTTQFGSGTVGYVYGIASSTTGLFYATNNSNSIITINRHPGDYYSQLGFSSSGGIFYRHYNNSAINTTETWAKVWTSNSLINLDQLSNGPGYITSYSETDTLASVTGRGNSTTSVVHLNSGNEFLRNTPSTVGAPQYQSWYNSAGTRRGYFGYGSGSSNILELNNESGGQVLIGAGDIIANGGYFRMKGGGGSAEFIWYKDYSGSPSEPGFVINNRAGATTFSHNVNGGGTSISGSFTAAGAISASNFSGTSSGTHSGTSSGTNTGDQSYVASAGKILGYQRGSFTVGGSTNTFYPVAFQIGSTATGEQGISVLQIERGGYDEPGYSNYTFSTFHCRIRAKADGWGYGASYVQVEANAYTQPMLAEVTQQNQTSQLIVWLRGGCAYRWMDIEGSWTLNFANGSGGNYVTYSGNVTYSPTTTNTIGSNFKYQQGWGDNYISGRLTASSANLGAITATTRTLNVAYSIGVRANLTGTEQEIFNVGNTGSGVNDGYMRLLDSGTVKVLIGANNARSGDTYFNGGGNFGINTDAPTNKLEVFSGSTTADALTLSFTTGADNRQTGIFFKGGPYPYARIVGGTSSYGPDQGFIAFYTNYNPSGAASTSGYCLERVRINPNGSIVATGDITAFGSPSDIKLKNIKEVVPNALQSILKLNGYRFDWKDVNHLTKIKEDIGVVAQEVEKVLPELARTNDDGTMSVRYQGLTAVLIEAIKEQQTQIESQKSEIDELKDLVQQLINR
jgi:hypothetical protein